MIGGRLRRLAGHGYAWFLDYVYVVSRQAHGLLRPVDPTTYRDEAAPRPPVVLLPGVYERWQFMRPVAALLHDLGHPVHVVTRLRWNIAPVDASAELVTAYLQEHDLRGVVVVAHSKGGLIGKYVMTHQDPEDRIEQMVAISTPFRGSVYARFFLVPAVRAFSPSNRVLRLLGEEPRVNDRITSIWAEFDPHIPRGSHLEGATNVELPVRGHFRIMGRPELLEAVARAVARPVTPRASPSPPAPPRAPGTPPEPGRPAAR
ncbi:esterase/lipase family protein [Ornithinimicrobium sp. W1665]|uniref:esterase/lipase family protein n=1 Tax=Ornithinimicrobium sp. W1665 TaxID=3416666 RepID=UPI003CFAC494